MGYEVFVYLNGSDPRLSLVGYPSFAANTHNHVVRVHAVDEVFQRVGIYLGIGVDLDIISEFPADK
jgi:hypothetical protein